MGLHLSLAFGKVILLEDVLYVYYARRNFRGGGKALIWLLTRFFLIGPSASR